MTRYAIVTARMTMPINPRRLRTRCPITKCTHNATPITKEPSKKRLNGLIGSVLMEGEGVALVDERGRTAGNRRLVMPHRSD